MGGGVDTGLEFGILGPLEVRRGGTLLRVGGPRQRALLGLLLCHANRVVSRDQLAEELLGDQPATAAERMLRVQVSRLRRVLAGSGGPSRVLAQPHTSKVEVTAKLCTPEGLVMARVPHRNKADYARARRWKWGDAVEQTAGRPGAGRDP